MEATPLIRLLGDHWERYGFWNMAVLVPVYVSDRPGVVFIRGLCGKLISIHWTEFEHIPRPSEDDIQSLEYAQYMRGLPDTLKRKI